MTFKQTFIALAVLIGPLLINAQSTEMREQNGLYGLFADDSLIVDYSFQDVTYRYSGTYGVKLNDKWGLIDIEGNVLIDHKYDTLRFNWGKGVIVSENGGTGVVTSTDSVLLALQYDDVDYSYQDSIALVKLNGKWGILEKDTIDYAESRLIFKSPETPPMFELCTKRDLKPDIKINDCATNKMLYYIYSKIKYPMEARLNGIQGVAVITFLVDENGEIKNSEIIRDIDGGCGDEALRVVRTMRPWVPATQDGKNVKTQFNLPIKFRLE